MQNFIFPLLEVTLLNIENLLFMNPSSNGKYPHTRKQNWNSEKSKNSRKFRWYDGKGRHLTAGGLLPYDGGGVWLIGEMGRSEDVEWTDLGGKYEYGDGDIYKTIAREVGEELYHSSELLRRDVFHFSMTYSPVYVNGHKKTPVYICYPVPIYELSKKGFVLDPDMFEICRQEVIKSNPMVPPNFYPAVRLKYFLYQDLRDALTGKENAPNLKFRLKNILQQFLPRIKKIEKYHKGRTQYQNEPPGISKQGHSHI